MNRSEYLASLKVKIDNALAAVTEWPEVSVPSRLTEAVRYSLLAPGKRLRPTLVLLAAEICGGNSERTIPAACAVEMIHSYSLIHDDLPAMDNDDYRRGRLTNHKAFDEATAILAGDGLLTFAFETILQTQDAPLAARMAAELAQAAGCGGMVGGQVEDVLFAEGRLDVSDAHQKRELLERIHRRKTAAMILVSLKLGALAADASAEQADALAVYGESLGLAFQITDDLLDLFGDEKTMGKRLQKDADAGKLTFPALLGVDESRKAAEREIERAKNALAVFPEESLAKESLLWQADYLLVRQK